MVLLLSVGRDVGVESILLILPRPREKKLAQSPAIAKDNEEGIKFEICVAWTW